MNQAPWSWWLGAIALSGVGLGFFVSSGKLMGVSGMLGRLVAPREQIDGPDAAGAPIALSFKAQLAFVLMLIVGGLLGQLSSGGWSLRVTLGDTFSRLWGTGGLSFAVLLVGGTLVGFGTRMSGGCTSGHGLSGCSRLQPGSLVATATFLGTAIGVSLLVAAVFG